MHEDAIVGVIAMALLSATITIGVVVTNIRRVVEGRAKATAQPDSAVVQELQDIKQQIADMRETTTKYDMSFDMALQRLEGRVVNLETEQQNRLGAGR